MTRPAAITKLEATEQLSTEVERWMREAIVLINSALMNFDKVSARLIDDHTIRLGVLPYEVQVRVIEEVVDYYTKAGWTVTHSHGDQRDNGGWFRFS